MFRERFENNSNHILASLKNSGLLDVRLDTGIHSAPEFTRKKGITFSVRRTRKASRYIAFNIRAKACQSCPFKNSDLTIRCSLPDADDYNQVGATLTSENHFSKPEWNIVGDMAACKPDPIKVAPPELIVETSQEEFNV